jgi:hypothetical protein
MDDGAYRQTKTQDSETVSKKSEVIPNRRQVSGLCIVNL